MFTPLQRTLTYNNKTLSLREWAKKTGISYDTIYARYRRGYEADEILGKLEIKKGRPYQSYKKGQVHQKTEYKRKISIEKELSRHIGE